MNLLIWLVAAAALLLAGCPATEPVRPDLTTGVKTVTVTKAVPVPCVRAEDVPPEVVTAMPAPDADIARKAAGASADVRALADQNKQLRALLIQCTEEPKP